MNTSTILSLKSNFLILSYLTSTINFKLNQVNYFLKYFNSNLYSFLNAANDNIVFQTIIFLVSYVKFFIIISDTNMYLLIYVYILCKLTLYFLKNLKFKITY